MKTSHPSLNNGIEDGTPCDPMRPPSPAPAPVTERVAETVDRALLRILVDNIRGKSAILKEDKHWLASSCAELADIIANHIRTTACETMQPTPPPAPVPPDFHTAGKEAMENIEKHGKPERTLVERDSENPLWCAYHTTYQSALRGDECAECLRQDAHEQRQRAKSLAEDLATAREKAEQFKEEWTNAKDNLAAAQERENGLREALGHYTAHSIARAALAATARRSDFMTKYNTRKDGAK